MALGKLGDTLIHYARMGRPVKLEGILSIWPIINTKGELSFGKRFDNQMKKLLNDMDNFHGQIENQEHIVWSEQEYIDAWNAEFPDDPIE